MTSVSDDEGPGAEDPSSSPHAEATYAGLTQVIGLATVRLTPEGVVDSCNSLAERLFGWPDGSGPGRCIDDQVVEHPEAAPDESFGLALDTGRAWAGRRGLAPGSSTWARPRPPPYRSMTAPAT